MTNWLRKIGSAEDDKLKLIQICKVYLHNIEHTLNRLDLNQLRIYTTKIHDLHEEIRKEEDIRDVMDIKI